MNVYSRLKLIAKAMDMPSVTDLSKKLVLFAKESPDPSKYFAETQIRKHFKEAKVGQSLAGFPGSDDIAKDRMALLVDDFLEHYLKGADCSLTFSKSLGLNSDPIDFLDSISLNPDDVASCLSPNGRAALDYIGSLSKAEKYDLPKKLRMSPSQVKRAVQPLSGDYEVYRFRGGLNDARELIVEKLIIKEGENADVVYIDKDGYEFNGMAIITDKIIHILLISDESNKKLPIIHYFSMFSSPSGAKENCFISSLNRSINGARVDNFRCVARRTDTSFSPHIKQKITRKHIEYFYVLDPATAQTGDMDSSFAIMKDASESRLIEGQKLLEGVSHTDFDKIIENKRQTHQDIVDIIDNLNELSVPT